MFLANVALVKMHFCDFVLSFFFLIFEDPCEL